MVQIAGRKFYSYTKLFVDFKMAFEEVGYEDLNWFNLAKNRDPVAYYFEYGN